MSKETPGERGKSKVMNKRKRRLRRENEEMGKDECNGVWVKIRIRGRCKRKGNTSVCRYNNNNNNKEGLLEDASEG